MPGRPRAASDEAIFRAITAVISESGPGGLTLGAIAERVGISAPALTQRFGSKRNLLLAYADASAADVGRIFDEARATVDSAVAAVCAGLTSFAGPATTREGLANSLAFLQLDLADPELGRRAAVQSTSLQRKLAELLREATRNGELVAANEDELADTIYTTYNGALITWAINGKGPLEGWLRRRLGRVLEPYRP